MGQIDNGQDEWLDEFVARHSLRERRKEDARQEQWETSKEGSILGETALTLVGYLMGFFISYAIFAILVIGIFFGTFAAGLMILYSLLY
jgi:hypothetical protein